MADVEYSVETFGLTKHFGDFTAGLLLKLSITTVPLACFQALYLYLALSVLGNYQSIYVPYRLRSDVLRRSKPNIWAVLAFFGIVLLLPLLMLPALACNLIGWAVGVLWGVPAWLTASACGALLLGAAVALYDGALQHAGDVLQRREHKILEILTRTNE